MRTVRLVDIITKSFERTEQVLFRPFKLKKWLRWIFIGVLSGNLFSMSATNVIDIPQKVRDKIESRTATPTQTVKTTVPAPHAQGALDKKEKVDLKQAQEALKKKIDEFFRKISKNKPLIMAFVAVVGVFLMMLIFFWWLSCRMEFIWYKTLTEDEVSIKDTFREYRQEARGLFNFEVWTTMLIIADIIFIAAVCFAMVSKAKQGALDAGGWVFYISILTAAVVFMFYWIVFVLFYVKNFIVPIMAIDRCTFAESWTKFWAIYREYSGDIVKFLIMFFLVTIVSSIATGIVVMVVLASSVLVLIVVFGGLYLLLYAVLKAHLAFAIVAVILGVMVLCALTVLIYMLMLPATVFGRNFALYYFSSLNTAYRPLPLENNGA